MLHAKSRIMKVTDNGGCKEALIIRVLVVGTRRRYANVGDVVVVTIKDANSTGNVKKDCQKQLWYVRATRLKRKMAAQSRVDDTMPV